MVDDVPPAGEGELLLVGMKTTPAGPIVMGTYDDRAAIWVSPDGGVWTRVQLPGAAKDTRVVAAAAGPASAVVAARGNVDGRGFGGVWRRGDDGWLPAKGQGTAFPPTSVVNSIVWTGTMYVAVGGLFPRDPDNIERATPAMWTSADGDDWQRQKTPIARNDGASFLAVSTGPGGIVAGGYALRGRTMDAVLVTSVDGTTWRPAKAQGLAEDQDETIGRVFATSQTWLVTGVVTPPKCRLTGCVTQEGRIWNSANLAVWTKADIGHDPPSVFAADDVAFFAIANRGDGFAIGSSPDGRNWSAVTPILAAPDDVIIGGWARVGEGFVVVGSTTGADQRVVAWRTR